MFTTSSRFIVTAALWLAALPAAAQLPMRPLPAGSDDAADASPYPATSTPMPVYRAPATSAPTTSRMFPGADLAAPPATDFPPVDGADADAALFAPGDLCPEVPTWRKRFCWLGPEPWDTGIELGLNGSSGTSESLSLRTGGYMKRESRFSRLDLRAYYNNTSSDGTTTQSNAQFDIRNDWLLDDSSPWTLFGTGTLFYDEFQAFDIETNGDVGLGYRVVDDPCVSLIVRGGAGASREFGGPESDWIPESLASFEYDLRLCTTQKLYSRLDYFPQWDEVGEYRLVAEASWEVELVQPKNMSLKFSATDRFDSTSEGEEPHLLNYSVLLLLKL